MKAPVVELKGNNGDSLFVSPDDVRGVVTLDEHDSCLVGVADLNWRCVDLPAKVVLARLGIAVAW